MKQSFFLSFYKMNHGDKGNAIRCDRNLDRQLNCFFKEAGEWIKCNQKVLQNIEIPNYNIQHCPTESSNGSALIYIKNYIIYIYYANHVT